MQQTYALSEQYRLDALTADRRVKPRVMVVDDVAAQRYAVVRALESEGFDVVEAATGAEALALSALMQFDAVVLDVHLPDVDGSEVCRRLKAASAVMLPILHLSATNTSEAARARGLDAGADGYLTHPFDPDVLRAAVSALVRLKRQEAARLAQVAATSLLKESLDALGDHIALLGPTGEIVAVNTAWLAFGAENGYADPGAGVGLNYVEVCALSTGHDAGEATAVAAGLRQLLAGEREQFEVDYPCHSPTAQRWFRMKARRVQGAGPVVAIVTHTDKSAEHERNQIDARFRQFVETTHECVLAMDAVGRITYANPCSGALFGYSPEEMVGRRFFDFMTPASDYAARTRFAGRWVGEASARVEIQVQGRGRVVELLVAESPIRDERGELVGVLAMFTDVTDRNTAQRATGDALRAADLDRRRLEATLEAIPVGVWLADADGRLTHTNPAADRVWGGTAPHVASVEEYGEYRATWPSTGARVAPHEWALARTLASGETILGEMMEIERFDGTRGFVLNSSAAIFDAEGAVTGGVVVNVDVTAQQAASAERDRLVASLERERRHLAAVFRMAPSFFAVVRGPSHVFERVNDAYQQLVGHRDIVGLPAADAMPEVVAQGFIELLDRVRTTGEPFVGSRIPIRLAREPGAPAEVRYVDFVYQRLDEPSGDHAVVAHGVDVTDHVLAGDKLLRSEARLRDQFAKLPVPTFLWELRGGEFELLDYNEAGAASLPGLSVSRAGQAAVPSFPDQSVLLKAMHESLRTDAVTRCCVELPTGPGAGPRSVDVTVGPQQPDRVLVHAVDTTDRVSLEEQLRQAQKMEAIGLLAGGVAHDFNNILTVIGAHASFLLETLATDDPQREDAEAIREAGTRAAGLTRQLLAFSRKQILKPRVVDLNAIVAETRQMLARLLGDDIEIVTDLEDDLPLLLADPGQLEQVLMNLSVNARDAMPDGGRLTLRTRRRTMTGDSAPAESTMAPGDYATLEVEDTGTGMSAEVQSRLFEPFFTTKPAGQGTGLGMATVYGIVKQSAGYITVTSAPGAGSTFQVAFPAVQAPVMPSAVMAAEQATARGGETVLVVEDEPAIRAATKRMLERLGYTVLDAANGLAAIALAASFEAPIHLVVSDAVMPGLGGVETVRRLQAQRASLKALFVSGYTSDEIMRRGIVSASLRFLQKPFTASDLGLAVRQALDAGELERA